MAHTTVNHKEPRSGFGVWYVGYEVHDPEGRRIGSVKELFTNGSGEPEYIRVRMGLFGLKSVLIPVVFVAVDDERRTITLG